MSSLRDAAGPSRTRKLSASTRNREGNKNTPIFIKDDSDSDDQSTSDVRPASKLRRVQEEPVEASMSSNRANGAVTAKPSCLPSPNTQSKLKTPSQPLSPPVSLGSPLQKTSAWPYDRRRIDPDAFPADPKQIAENAWYSNSPPVNMNGHTGAAVLKAAHLQAPANHISSFQVPSVEEGSVNPDIILQHVLEILPDLDPEWANPRIASLIVSGQRDRVAEIVVDQALDLETGYPVSKVIEKGKGKAKEDEEPKMGYESATYRVDMRRGKRYILSAVASLGEDFCRTPVPHIHATFVTNGSLYTPTFFALYKHSKASPKPYKELRQPRKSKKPFTFDKPLMEEHNGQEEFRKERLCLMARLRKKVLAQEEEKARKLAFAEAIANGQGIECGCCFGDELPENMYQCAEGHLFCKDCTTMNADTKLGDQQTAIVCMDSSGCKADFPESELTRALRPKTLLLWHRLKQSKELKDAAIEGLESCPSCPFSAIIDNPQEKLFRCLNEACGQVTCRKCRRKEHIPKTCEEVAAERKVDSRHAVEDAMSEALIRKCPKCEKPFIKEAGCNKIICSTCRTMSCYICRKVITGYDHFDQNPANYRAPKDKTRCILWDTRHSDYDVVAIRAARDAAAAEARVAAEAEGNILNEKDIHVDLPDQHVAPPHVRMPNLADLAHLRAHIGQRMQAGMVVPNPPGVVGAGIALPGAGLLPGLADRPQALPAANRPRAAPEMLDPMGGQRLPP